MPRLAANQGEESMPTTAKGDRTEAAASILRALIEAKHVASEGSNNSERAESFAGMFKVLYRAISEAERE